MPYPVIDKDKCNNDSKCIDTCPMDVFEKTEKGVVVVNPDACIGCRACEATCPKKAIEIKE